MLTDALPFYRRAVPIYVGTIVLPITVLLWLGVQSFAGHSHEGPGQRPSWNEQLLLVSDAQTLPPHSHCCDEFPATLASGAGKGTERSHEPVAVPFEDCRVTISALPVWNAR